MNHKSPVSQTTPTPGSARFFIIGCQRSGTTLLRLILDSHSKISCADENVSYDVLSDSNKLKNYLENNRKVEWSGFKIPRLTEQIHNPVIHDYGLAKPIQNFYEVNPLIFLVRDCRDVVCSMKNLHGSGNSGWLKSWGIPTVNLGARNTSWLKSWGIPTVNLGARNTSWLELWGIPIVNYWIKNSPNFKQSFGSDITKVKGLKHYELAMASLYWKFKNSAYFTYVKLKYPIIKIRYEDLVANPKDTILTILNFLGLEWEDSVLKHHTMEHSEIDKDGYAIGKTNAHFPINISSVGQYANELDSEQLYSIISISGDLMKKFDYF